MEGRYKINEIVFGNWTIKTKIGEGSFGKVYEIHREDFGETYKAALKVITVPSSKAELSGALEEGMDLISAKQYFYSIVEDIVREFSLMAKLKGTTNIVSYEDHMVVAHKNGIGWDILIRMELLTPLLSYAYISPFTRRDIIRLGINMCHGLELCQKYNIIHRDIKPENIFVSGNGDFKLGDFGIARTVEKTMSGLSKKGTYNYMAPEVYRGREYGFSVDIYSLGIVLYRLLNRNRLPFLPAPPSPITYSNRETALAQRMGGKKIPKPFHAEGRLAEIVEKAVLFEPKERYSSPIQMRQELEAIQYNQDEAEIIYPDGDDLVLKENIYINQTPAVTEGGDEFSDSLGTASMFGETKHKQHDTSVGTSKTASIFQYKNKDVSAGKKQKKTRKVLFIVSITIFVSIGISIFLWQDNIVKKDIKKRAEYDALVERTKELYDHDPAKAADLLLQAQSMYPEEVGNYVGYAYALYCDREYATCIAYIEDELALGKGFDINYQSQLSEILGAAYFEEKEYAAAASFFRLSTAGGNLTVPSMRDYAVSLGRLGDINAAEEVLARMFDAGADEWVTKYVQAEIDYAQEEYLNAEIGFRLVFGQADESLQLRALRTLAELYRDCVVLDKLGTSPISNPATREVEVLTEGLGKFSQQFDSTLWEMLAQAYYDAYQTDTTLDESWLQKSADAFRQVINLGIQKEYLYSNLFTINYELKSYEDAENILFEMKERYPNSYIAYALRSMLLITLESNKLESERNYTAAYEEYKLAESMLRSGDDSTYFQQLESIIQSLISNGWL